MENHYFMLIVQCKTAFVRFRMAGNLFSKRIENGGEEVLIKVGMLIIVFKFAENTKGETDFYSG